MSTSYTRRSRDIGIALSPNRLVAFLPSGRATAQAKGTPRLWVRPLVSSVDANSWGNLTEVLAELRAITGGGRLHVTLMPPLAHLRRLELAGLNEAEATRIVSRDPSRFVALQGRPELTIVVEGSGWRRMSPFALSAISSSALEELGAAARASGWSLGSVRPAPLAWAAAAARRRTHDCVACLASHVEVVRGMKGTPVSFRRLRVQTGLRTAESVRALLAERGIDIARDATVMLSDDEAMAVAAEYAVCATGPLALPDREQANARRRQRRGTIGRFVAAGILLALTAALELWDVQRERTNVADARARIQRPLSDALAVRESLSVAKERLATIRSLESSAPRWSSWVAQLAERLPTDAFLVSLSAGGDSLRLEGAATRAAPVFDALSGVPGVRSVRPEGPIRQELRGGDAASEHFQISASLDRRDLAQPAERAAPKASQQAAAGRTP